jgi:predicted XRE-type DNA-binding protein
MRELLQSEHDLKGIPDMTAEEFRKTIAAFGMSQGGACRFFGISRNRISDYVNGRARVPELIAMTLALMRHFDVSPAAARHIAGLPQVKHRDGRQDMPHLGRKRKLIGAAIKMGHGGPAS